MSALKQIILPEHLQEKTANFPELKMNFQLLTLIDKNGTCYDNIKVISGRVAYIPDNLDKRDIIDIDYRGE